MCVCLRACYYYFFFLTFCDPQNPSVCMTTSQYMYVCEWTRLRPKYALYWAPIWWICYRLLSKELWKYIRRNRPVWFGIKIFIYYFATITDKQNFSTSQLIIFIAHVHLMPIQQPVFCFVCAICRGTIATPVSKLADWQFC